MQRGPARMELTMNVLNMIQRKMLRQERIEAAKKAVVTQNSLCYRGVPYSHQK